MSIGSKVTKNVEIHNDTGISYVKGREGVEGSKRLDLDTASGFVEVQNLIDGIWQPSSFRTGPNSLWVGRNVGIAGLGHHLATEASDGHLHFHVHSEYVNGLSTTDAQVINSYSYLPHEIVVPFDTGEWTGTTYNYNYPSIDHRMFKNVYYKTGATAATENVTFQVWEGSDDTGTPFFEQTYPASNFPANTEITVQANGYLEFDKDKNYYIRVSSAANFSLKCSDDLVYPWTAGDISLVREDNLLQTAPYKDGDTYAVGQYLIQDRQIYVCNATGIQSGTFASNSDKWDLLSSTANDHWYVNGSTLQNIAGPTLCTFNTGGIDVFGFSKTQSFIWADNPGNYLAIAGATLIFKDGTRNRVEINDGLGYLRLTSKDGSQTYSITDAAHTMTGAINIVSPSGNNLVVSDTALTLNDGTRDRVIAYGLNTKIVGYNGLQHISVDADNIEIVSDTSYLNVDPTTMYFYDGTEERFNINSAGTTITGDLFTSGSISNGIDTGSYIIANRMSQDYAGGGIGLVGAENGSGVKWPDFSIDNFWGYLRIYTGGVGDRYVRMVNVDPTEPTASNRLHLMVDGGIMVGDGASYKTASAGIEIKSTTEALLLSRLTTTERNALTATAGMVVFNTTTTKMECYDGSTWQAAW